MLTSFANGAVQNFYNRDMLDYTMKKEQEQYEKNQETNLEYSRKLAGAGITGNINALREAGMNPTAAVQGGFSPVAMPQAPMSSKSPSVFSPNMAQDLLALSSVHKQEELLDAQRRNVDADTANKLQGVDTDITQAGLNVANTDVAKTQADKNKAEADRLRAETANSMYELKRKRDFDSTIFNELMAQERSLMEPFFAKNNLSMDNNEDVEKARNLFSSGSFDALSYYEKLGADRVENINRKAVAEAFNNDPQLTEMKAQLTRKEYDRLEADISHLKTLSEKDIALRQKLETDTELSEQQKRNLEKEIIKIEAEVGEIKARESRVTSEKFRNYAIGGAAIADSAWDIAKSFLPQQFLKNVTSSKAAPMREKTTTTYKETKTGWKREVNKERFPIND